MIACMLISSLVLTPIVILPSTTILRKMRETLLQYDLCRHQRKGTTTQLPHMIFLLLLELHLLLLIKYLHRRSTGIYLVIPDYKHGTDPDIFSERWRTT